MPFLFVCWSLEQFPALDTPSEIQHFTPELKKIKVSSNQSSRAKKTAFSPLNYRHLYFTLAPVFCCFLPLLNPLKLLHTCSHCFSEHLCCIFTLPGTLQCEKKRSWLGCLGEQHQPLSVALGQLSSKQSIQSQTLKESLLFKHLLDILLDRRLKLGQKGPLNTCRTPWYNASLISLYPVPKEHSTRFWLEKKANHIKGLQKGCKLSCLLTSWHKQVRSFQ